MTRIRVLTVIDRLNVGGPALLASVLADRLDPTRFEHRLLAGSIDPDEADFVALRAPGLRVERVRGLGRAPSPFDDARALAQIGRSIRSFRPHVVHTHKAKAGLIGRLAAWGLRVPATAHTFHGHLLHGYFSPAKTRAITTVEALLARPTTRLVAVGARVRDELIEAGIGRREQYTVIPPGVQLGPIPDRATARHALGLPPDAHVVTYVGRLAPVKRPDRFVDLAMQVARTDPRARFLVVGAGEELDATRARARPLGDHVHFAGWRADVENVYAASDVVVLTSDNEGMPVSLIEAAMAGVPAVTTGVGSAAEVVDDGRTGIVTRTDVGDLAQAVERLLGDDDLRRSMGAAASTHAHREFGAERLARDIARLYEDLAATSRRPPTVRDEGEVTGSAAARSADRGHQVARRAPSDGRRDL